MALISGHCWYHSYGGVSECLSSLTNLVIRHTYIPYCNVRRMRRPRRAESVWQYVWRVQSYTIQYSFIKRLTKRSASTEMRG